MWGGVRKFIEIRTTSRFSPIISSVCCLESLEMCGLPGFPIIYIYICIGAFSVFGGKVAEDQVAEGPLLRCWNIQPWHALADL